VLFSIGKFSVIERENMFATMRVDLRHQWLITQELKDEIDNKALAANMPLSRILAILILISQAKSYRKV